MALDIGTVKTVVKKYADDVRQIMPVAKVYLYGSHAKGNATEHSDIDVCFFLPNFGDKEWIDIMVLLFNNSYKYDASIEPYVFEISDIEDDNPFVKEVLRTGIEIS
jgi:predicted nucleotidyltransferase